MANKLIKPGKLEHRRYQKNIASTCMQRSTLVVLPTGMGKTVIALLVIAEKVKDGKVVFLAPTKPLVEQHYSFLRDLLVIEEIAMFTGEVAPTERSTFWEKNRIVVSTPQVIKNDLLAGRINLEHVSLVVFDEAHRAVGNYSYVYISERYGGLILGMTASPGSTTSHILEVCKNLGINEVEVRTGYEHDVKPYRYGIERHWVRVPLPPELRWMSRKLEDVLYERTKTLRSMGLVKPKGRVSTKELLECRKRIQSRMAGKRVSALYHAASVCSSAIKVNHALELAQTQGVAALRRYLDTLKKDRSRAGKGLLKDARIQKVVKIVKGIKSEHPKFKKAVDVVKEQLARKPESRIIVFAHYRDTAKLMVNKLREENVSAIRFVGQANKEGDRGLKQREQVEILNRFKHGEYYVLVCTSVGEEGLDIPSTDLVVFYEPIPSEIRTIQRRGRTGRKRPGKVVILITTNSRDEAYYWASKHKEERMLRGLLRLKKELHHDISTRKRSGQAKLAEFDCGEIIIDNRELSTPVATELSKLGVKLLPKQLEIGDYLISDRVCVERKRAEDFVDSIIDHRLFQQLSALKENYTRPILLLEGKELFGARAVTPEAIYGALASVATDFGIPVLSTNSPEETAKLLFSIFKRENEEGAEISFRPGRKPLALHERQQYVLEGLPHISVKLAQRLLTRFKSIRAVANADKKRLMEVEGIGEHRATELLQVLRAKYLR